MGKYDSHVVQKPFRKASEEFGGGMVFKHDNDHNSGIIFEHHIINDPDWTVDKIRTNDTHELLCFIGANPENIRDLGAEIRLNLGKNDEEQVINDTTVVSIPPGLKNGPIKISKFTKPFVLLRIINKQEYQDKVDADSGGESSFKLGRLRDGNEVAKHGKHYWMNIFRGPLYVDYEPGWTGTSIWAHHDEFSAGISLGYHCIVTPYDVRFSHGHDFHENLCFLSGDPNNPEELGADIKVCLGDEQEEHTVINTPTMLSMPPGLKHCPMLISNITRPVVFLEVSATKLFLGKPEDV
ncbi:MAG: hypothetical protein JW762_17270 [Dehalococcoidales bacterium]|nr:hypothetical protein [Dehalococcoidales bacterium]